MARIKKHVINPVESREADLGEKDTLRQQYASPRHRGNPPRLHAPWTTEEVDAFVKKYGLAMDDDDLAFCRDYFASEHRDPTHDGDPHDGHLLVRSLPPYHLPDHHRRRRRSSSRQVEKAFERYLQARKAVYGDRQKPVNLDGRGYHGRQGAEKSAAACPDLDESEEINACSIKIDVDVDGVKRSLAAACSRTRPTTIPRRSSPSAARPPASAAPSAIRCRGRAYVYQAMRVTGAADPADPVADTMPGKLPQRKMVHHRRARAIPPTATRSAWPPARWTRSITRATWPSVMEIGAVVGAAPEENVRRECPAPGDMIVLLGGRTGPRRLRRRHRLLQGPQRRNPLRPAARRCRRATPPTERKLQRLFRNREVTRLIKRCNDFGAGGVCVAIGELADGLDIDLDLVPKKYEGLDGTELAISEIPGAHGRGAGPRGCGRLPRGWPTAKTWRPPWWPR